MTRAVLSDIMIDHRIFGDPEAERSIVLLRSGVDALSDPRSDVTDLRKVKVIAVGLTAAEVDDHAAYRGTGAAEATARTITRLIGEDATSTPVGVVGVGAAGGVAIRVAAGLGARVDRLALVGVPTPRPEIGNAAMQCLCIRVSAKTLLMNGQGDPLAAHAAAEWFKDRLPSARVEMVPSKAIIASSLPLGDVWERVLSHVAPRTLRSRAT